MVAVVSGVGVVVGGVDAGMQGWAVACLKCAEKGQWELPVARLAAGAVAKMSMGRQ